MPSVSEWSPAIVWRQSQSCDARSAVRVSPTRTPGDSLGPHRNRLPGAPPQRTLHQLSNATTLPFGGGGRRCCLECGSLAKWRQERAFVFPGKRNERERNYAIALGHADRNDSTARAARWKTVSGSSSSTSFQTVPAHTRCGRTSYGCPSPLARCWRRIALHLIPSPSCGGSP